MDPLSQAVVGAIVPMNVSTKAKLRLAALCGMVGGLVPDLDIYIKSETDPLLYLEYHRHFTHALLSIPFLGVFFWCLFVGVIKPREIFVKVLHFIHNAWCCNAWSAGYMYQLWYLFIMAV